jgi:flagellar biosynthesis component FlhA
LTAALSQEGGELTLNVPTEVAMDLNRRVAGAWRSAMDQGHEKIVLLCDARLRGSLARMLSRTLQMLPVVAYDEIVLGTDVESIETITAQQQDPLATASKEEMAVV